MTKDQITDWLMAWFENRVPGVELAPDENYVVKGVIDSFGIVELIEAIESQFAITFDQADMQSLELFSVDGLSSIVSRKLT